MDATSFLTSFTYVVFLQVRAKDVCWSSLEIEPVPQVWVCSLGDWVDDVTLSMCMWKQSPCCKRLWIIRGPGVAPNNIGKSVDLLQTSSIPDLKGRQLLFILLIYFKQHCLLVLIKLGSGVSTGVSPQTAAGKLPQKQSHACDQRHGPTNTYQGIPLCSHCALWAIHANEQADSLIYRCIFL